METEIKYQIKDLQQSESNKVKNLGISWLFAGAGDSRIAAMVAQYASGLRFVSCHPVDIVLEPKATIGRTLCLISISGNTKVNIEAALSARRQNGKTVAITARPQSLLAESCDETIQLNYRSTGITTSGTVSFTSSMLASLSLLQPMKSLKNLAAIYAWADRKTTLMVDVIQHTNCFTILGDGISFAVAMYGTLKFNEVLGARAFAYPIEEFCHSPLFGAKRTDQIIILGKRGSNEKAHRSKNQIGFDLHRRLLKEKFTSIYVDCHDSDALASLIKSIFFLQLLVVKLARKNGLKDCYFLQSKKRNRDLLKLSSDYIYSN